MSDRSAIYNKLVEVLIEATKAFDVLSTTECIAIANLLITLNTTRQTNIDTMRRLTNRMQPVLDREKPL